MLKTVLILYYFIETDTIVNIYVIKIILAGIIRKVFQYAFRISLTVCMSESLKYYTTYEILNILIQF